MTNAEAWQTYEAFLADDRIAMASNEPTGLEANWKRFASTGKSSPKLWMDAYLAAFAMSAGLQLVTIDSDFRQFDGPDTHFLN